MERGPVLHQNAFATLAVVGLEVAAAIFAIIDPQPGFALYCDRCKPMIVFFLAERTARSPVAPLGMAAAAEEHPEPARILAPELRHRGRRPAEWAVVQKPAFLIAPLRELRRQRPQETLENRPAEILKQPRMSARAGIAFEQPDDGATWRFGITVQLRIQ